MCGCRRVRTRATTRVTIRRRGLLIGSPWKSSSSETSYLCRELPETRDRDSDSDDRSASDNNSDNGSDDGNHNNNGNGSDDDNDHATDSDNDIYNDDRSNPSMATTEQQNQ